MEAADNRNLYATKPLMQALRQEIKGFKTPHRNQSVMSLYSDNFLG